MTRYCQEDPGVEDNYVNNSINGVRAWEEHDYHNYELSISNEKPRENGTNNTADILQI